MSAVHSSVVAHQFDDVEQQHQSYSLGMWLFLANEIMFFGGLFVAYIVYRWAYPEAFAEASGHLDIVLATVNTAALLTSSFTMALAVRAIQIGKIKQMVGFLMATIGFAIVFLVLKGIEYGHKFQDHLVPGPNFVWHGTESAQHVEMFFGLYFTMTALHGLHVLIGIFVIGTIAYLGWKKRFSPDYYAPVEMTGLYWHLVDIVWVFLFPLLYLVARHG